jgi:hypothetical protein
MKIPINLASQPFRRNRAMMVASSAVMALLVVTMGILIQLAMQDHQQMADVRHEVGLLKRQIQTVTAQQTHNRRSLTPSYASRRTRTCWS